MNLYTKLTVTRVGFVGAGSVLDSDGHPDTLTHVGQKLKLLIQSPICYLKSFLLTGLPDI